MKISESWLRSWVNPDIDTAALAAQLTMAGLEVDALEPVAKPFSGVVVGEVVSVAPHPDADKLRVCQVTDGNSQVQVVCGAPNAREGIRVPFAKVGAVLPENFKIKKAKLRGVESFGMLCAREELGVAGDSEGLWELPLDAEVGADLTDALSLNDVLIDIDLTPNRADCLSIRGVAREIGVLNSVDVCYPEIPEVPSTSKATQGVEIVATEDCPRYLSRVIAGINVDAVTPFWMSERLARSDIGTIHPVVDVTNYVMLELGQPMHAFDLSKLDGSIVVRKAMASEKILLLDDKEVQLTQETLVIADQSGPLAIAGIMGGKASGVTSGTTDIVLESAFFEPLSVTGKARDFGLHTDSSHRFERGVDTELQVSAIERATELLLSIVGGAAGPTMEHGVYASGNGKPPASVIRLRLARLERVLGCRFSEEAVTEILTRLGLEVMSCIDGVWEVTPPSWRFDLALEADLIEEIARVHGYDRLPEEELSASLSIGAHDEQLQNLNSIKNQMVSRGFREVINYSFIDPELHALCFPDQTPVKVENPIAADMSVMRSSLVPGLLMSAQYNLNRQQTNLRLFECGMVFNSVEVGGQQNRIAGLITGVRAPEGWANSSDKVDFYDIKNEVALLLSRKGNAGAIDYLPETTNALLHPGQSASVISEGETIGWVAKLHPRVQAKLDLGSDVFLFELDESYVRPQSLPAFKAVSKFPAVRRDIALVVHKDLQVSELIAEAHSQCGELLTEARIFDIYMGQGIDSNEKSVGMGLTFRDYSRTLNDEQVTLEVKKLVDHLSVTHSARQR